jgi:hypothetical protein
MSEIKVNKISPKQTCTQVTLGDSGDTFTIPAGVTLTNNGTATGFGPTGAVSWNTTKITADPNPAVSGVGYFADTTSSAFTVTLPAAPSAGDIVALSDYTGTWETNNVTVGRNSSNINGAASDLILNGNNTTATLIYVDATEGWRVIDTGSLSEVNGIEFVLATGGTVTCCGDYKIHTFTGPGTFTVTSAGNSLGSNSVSYLVVAGGGGGGGDVPNGYGAAGGGAGGYREGKASTDCYTASPLNAPAGLPVSIQAYPITVGGGGAAGTTSPITQGTRGSTSTFSTISSTGGGGGNIGASAASPSPAPGGSGGGGAGPCSASPPNNAQGVGGTGNTPPVSPPQGNNGGNARTPATPKYGGGGGGGATAVGENFNDAIPGNTAGDGGAGATTSISGSPTAYAGGGGGGAFNSVPAGDNTTDGAGGTGGGGPGGQVIPGNSHDAVAGTTNTGGGGGGAASNNPGTPGVVSAGAGGSGIVIIRYKFQ